MSVRSNPGAAGLTAAILLVFLIQVVVGHSDGGALVRVGAVGPRLWSHGHIWTLASSTLVHFGVVHALFNAYFVWAIGKDLERLVGTERLLVVFFVGGLVGSLLSAGFTEGVSAGASGGGWGLMIALLLVARWPSLAVVDEPRVSNTRGILVLVALNGLISFVPGINGIAHLGGGMGGGIMLVFGRSWPKAVWQVLGVGLVMLHGLALASALWVGSTPTSGEGLETAVLDDFVHTIVPAGVEVVEQTLLTVTHGDLDWDGMVVFTELELDDTPIDQTVLQLFGQTTPNPCPDRLGFDLIDSNGTLTVRDYGAFRLLRLVFVDAKSNWNDFKTQHRCAGRLAPGSVELANALLDNAPSALVVRTSEAMLEDLPNHPSLLNKLAWHLATSTVDDVRDGQRAVMLAERAVALDSSTANLDTLAAAYAEAGRFAEAVATQEQVVARPDAEASNQAALVLLRQGRVIRSAPPQEVPTP